MLLLSFRVSALTAALLLASSSLAHSQDLPAPEGWAALERGDGSKAAAIFRDALDRAPYNAILHYGSAQASLMLGRTEAAISSLKKAVQHDPKFVEALVLLAQVAYSTAELDLAIKSLERAAVLVPRHREIAAVLAKWKKEAELHSGFQSQVAGRFNVMFEGPAQQAIGTRVSSVLERAYWSIGKQLDIYPGAALDVILYSNKQFMDVTRAPAWAGGGYDGRIRLPINGALKRPDELDRIVVHEYVHAVVRTAAATGVPAWVNEGLASYLEPGDKTWVAKVLKSTPERIALVDLEEGFGGLDGETALLAYAQSHVAGGLLVEKLQPYVGAFLQLLGNGHTVDQALSRHGVEPAAFHAEWRRRVRIREATR